MRAREHAHRVVIGEIDAAVRDLYVFDWTLRLAVDVFDAASRPFMRWT